MINLECEWCNSKEFKVIENQNANEFLFECVECEETYVVNVLQNEEI